MASFNALGKIGDDGILRDVNGNEVPVGLDDTAKAELQALIDGPKVREMPSEKDAFESFNVSLKARDYKPEDSQQSGTLEDLGGNPEAPAGSVAATNTTAKKTAAPKQSK